MGAAELADENAYGSGSSPVVYDRLGAGVGDPILYVEGAEAIFSPDTPGEYLVEVTVTTVGADQETGELNATSTFTSRIVVQGVALSDSCDQRSGALPLLSLLLVGLFAFASRRRVA